MLQSTIRRTSSLFIALAAICPAQQPTKIKVLPQTTGTFTQALSTSFQTAPWTDSAFTAHPEIPALLNQLNPHHIRIQVIDKSIPETAPGVWDYTALDRQLQPILTAADRSPEIQLAQAPAFLYRNKADFVTPAFIAGYADYAAKMVQHYPAVLYWGILNEPDYFHISPAEYVQLYNAAASAMRAASPKIKLVALELGGEPADERRYIPFFVHHVTAPVDLMSIHFYSSCDQRDTDQKIFDTVPGFARQLRYIRRELQFNPKLRSIPIWILENNVNADFVGDHGESTCNPTQIFTEDLRGTSPFFPAWRAYEFSRYGQAGSQALYHWVFIGDAQDSEYNTEDTPAHLQLSFWIDLWLGKLFPPRGPAHILAVANHDPLNLELFAVRQAGGKIVVMLCNHAVASPTDHNGRGAARTVQLDLSALGPFTSARQVTFDQATDPLKGPTEIPITPSPLILIPISGYGVTFLTLQ